MPCLKLMLQLLCSLQKTAAMDDDCCSCNSTNKLKFTGFLEYRNPLSFPLGMSSKPRPAQNLPELVTELVGRATARVEPVSLKKKEINFYFYIDEFYECCGPANEF